MKKCAFVRSDVNNDKKCPFGLPITTACEHAGNSVTHMCPLPMVEADKQDVIKLANARVYIYYKTGERCIYAANIIENKQSVNCDFGDTAAGMHGPPMMGSPLYAQTFAGVGLDALYSYPLGFYADNSASRNLFEGLFSLIGSLENEIIKEALSKDIIEKLENKEILNINERLELEGFLEDYQYYFSNMLDNNEKIEIFLEKLRR